MAVLAFEITDVPVLGGATETIRWRTRSGVAYDLRDRQMRLAIGLQRAGGPPLMTMLEREGEIIKGAYALEDSDETYNAVDLLFPQIKPAGIGSGRYPADLWADLLGGPSSASYILASGHITFSYGASV